MSEEAKKIIPSHTNKNIFDIIKKCALSENDEYKLMQYTKKGFDIYKHPIFPSSGGSFR